tara:strand:+ start:139 stop:300 length:162 start_codon:yes stop_codon:yes gene_type:complete
MTKKKLKKITKKIKKTDQTIKELTKYLFKLKLKQGQLALKNNKKPFTGFENII